jgi:hypothetical protein
MLDVLGKDEVKELFGLVFDYHAFGEEAVAHVSQGGTTLPLFGFGTPRKRSIDS